MSWTRTTTQKAVAAMWLCLQIAGFVIVSIFTAFAVWLAANIAWSTAGFLQRTLFADPW